MVAENKIILHWLDQSRSHRILWLLELLNVNYELKIYKRNKGFRAPKELYDVHPLGKSPIIDVVKPSGEKETIAETACIIEYLIDNYDHEQKFAPVTDEGKKQVNYFLHYTEGSLQPYITGAFVTAFAKTQAPFGTQTLIGIITGRMNDMYYKTEAITNFKYLETIAKKNDGGWFVDNKLTAVDIMFAYPIAEVVFFTPDGGELFQKKNYPYLAKWAKKVENDPAYKKATSVIDSQSKL